MSPSNTDTTKKEKNKPGRPPKPESEKVKGRIFLSIWENEMEMFKNAAGREPVAAFLRNAIFELIDLGTNTIEEPSPVSKVEGFKYMLLVTRDEKKLFSEVAANRFGWPLSSLVRAAGLRKAGLIKHNISNEMLLEVLRLQRAK